jgi:hypothetical protein
VLEEQLGRGEELLLAKSARLPGLAIPAGLMILLLLLLGALEDGLDQAEVLLLAVALAR